MRNVVIACDGTWNRPDQRDRGRCVPSNVVKLTRAVAAKDAEGREQHRYYTTGVGTSGFLDKYRGGVTGSGLFGNMREAYSWLIGSSTMSINAPRQYGAPSRSSTQSNQPAVDLWLRERFPLASGYQPS